MPETTVRRKLQLSKMTLRVLGQEHLAIAAGASPHIDPLGLPPATGIKDDDTNDGGSAACVTSPTTLPPTQSPNNC